MELRKLISSDKNIPYLQDIKNTVYKDESFRQLIKVYIAMQNDKNYCSVCLSCTRILVEQTPIELEEEKNQKKNITNDIYIKNMLHRNT